MVYQWYPGHMTKARRAMQEDIKLIDLIIELVDARCPQSSRNPDIDEMGKNKARLILLIKSDLSVPAAFRAWTAYFESLGFAVLEINARSGAGMKAIQGKVQEACREKIERDRKRGILNLRSGRKERTTMAKNRLPAADVTEDPHYHDTWTLLRKYRDVVWSLEVSVRQIRNRFRIDYGKTIEDFLESVYLAGADLSGTELEHQAKCIEQSHKMLCLVDSAVDLMRAKHKNGEEYYWLLFYA